MFYVRVTNRAGMRGGFGFDEALKVASSLMTRENQGADVTIGFVDGTVTRTYRYTLADDGYWGWHNIEPEEA